METVRISNIQRFSLDDGPGIRTTVFLKGCNLKCLWCHNPECISGTPCLQYREVSCKMCGACESVCAQGVHQVKNGSHMVFYEKCIKCGACQEVCIAEAVSIVGKEWKIDDVIKEIEKDAPYYEDSNGGVTFSGGEPMLQKDSLRILLERSKELGYRTAVDTAGDVPFEWYKEILDVTDVFLYDVKSFEEELHRQLTGISNHRIKENLCRLNRENADIIVRVPVIGGANAFWEEMEKIADFLSGLQHIKLVQLLPYHDYGVAKYRTIGVEYTGQALFTPSREFMETLLKMFLQKGIPASF